MLSVSGSFSFDITVVSTRGLHHARPELRLFVQRVVLGALQLVDVNAGCCGQAAVMTDEQVKSLKRKRNTKQG